MTLSRNLMAEMDPMTAIGPKILKLYAPRTALSDFTASFCSPDHTGTSAWRYGLLTFAMTCFFLLRGAIDNRGYGSTWNHDPGPGLRTNLLVGPGGIGQVVSMFFSGNENAGQIDRMLAGSMRLASEKESIIMGGKSRSRSPRLGNPWRIACSNRSGVPVPSKRTPLPYPGSLSPIALRTDIRDKRFRTS